MADFSNSNADSVYMSRELSDDQDDESSELTFIVVGKRCRNNAELKESLKVLGMSFEYSDTGFEFLTEADEDTVFVMDNFEGDIFTRLHRAGARIMGPTVLNKCAKNSEKIPSNTRPLYCTLMKDLILCFTGFKRKEDLSRLADLVHHMGGSIRKDFSSRVTHLVANCTGGEKYRVAVSLGTPIMGEEWVNKCWECKDDVSSTATDEIMMLHRMSPFYLTTISFLGFSKDEQRHMEEITVENGGTYAEPGAPTCTHLVVDEHAVKTIPFDVHSKLHIVKSDWFWGSIQMDACADESMYRFEEAQPETPSSNREKTPKTLSGNKSRKRKRLRENLAQLAAEGDVDSPMLNCKRRSNEIARVSFSASFLDATADTSGTPTDLKDKQSPTSAKASTRQLIAMELLQTEKNYVGILNTVLKVFKEEIEREDQPGGPILDPQDIKVVFGKLPPIYEVHTKIRDELSEIVNNWHEEQCIGSTIMRHAEELLKAYPPFVNFFENSKETINQCDKTKPRFHAFLKVCQSKPECGRQTLTELLIRPVQRLPSVMLLMKELLKRTERTNPDHTQLINSIETLEEVMTHINEDKRKAEGHQIMFDIVNDIDNCPANLLSSHRKFISRIDVIEMTDSLSGRGDNLSLFLFSDSLELCKRRVKVLNAKSPAAHGAKTPQKAYKHLEMLQLNSIKRVVNINDTKEYKNIFALVTKEMNKDIALYAFMIIEDDINKDRFLTDLSRQIANTTYRADYENLLESSDASSLLIDTSDLHNKTLSKAASKFGKRVSRAFSFNKTPRKLKRAMSSMTQMMSPFNRRESLSLTNVNTPNRGNLTAMRLASTNDLSEDDTFGPSLMQIDENFGQADSFTLHRNQDNLFATPIGEPFKTPISRRTRRRETLAGSLTYANLLAQVRKERGKERRRGSILKGCSPSATPSRKSPYDRIVTRRRASMADVESPLSTMGGSFSVPGTPKLSSQFNKSATIGHAAGSKLL